MWNLPPIKPSRVSDEDGSILGRRGGSRCPAFSRRQEERWCGRKDSLPVQKGIGPARDGAIPYAEAGSWRPAGFSASKREGQGDLVRAEGLEPSRALRPNGFSCHLRLSPPPSGVRGLDYSFTVSQMCIRLRGQI